MHETAKAALAEEAPAPNTKMLPQAQATVHLLKCVTFIDACYHSIDLDIEGFYLYSPCSLTVECRLANEVQERCGGSDPPLLCILNGTLN
ncbi:hypothetical protein [Paenibacillus thermotolerans]|uniref:hypothetical protein n=1 Tax=Paenibacillus thermotolerans TaxID=3027807 RepID=UPI002367AA22|nr:hypothetical protein [Paenibacillus sp. YIM B05602]